MFGEKNAELQTFQVVKDKAFSFFGAE